jgi:hypothetical protein
MPRFLGVRNWEKMQHQSDRRLPWIKSYISRLEPTREPAFALLPDITKALLHQIELMARVFNNKIPEDWLIRERLNVQAKVNLEPLLRSGYVFWWEDSSQTFSQTLDSLTRAGARSESLSLSGFSLEGESEGEPAWRRAAFDALWRDYPRKRGKEKAFSHYCAQVQSRQEHALIETAVRNYRREVEILGIEERYVLHGSTFFNGRWRDFADGVWHEPTAPKPRVQQPQRPNFVAPSES